MIFKFFKKITISIACFLKPKIVKKFLCHSIFSNNYNKLKNVNSFECREDLWTYVLEPFKDAPITLLEFGVWEGYSIKFFATLNTNKNSSFSGFDSFQGLPLDWDKVYPKGAFSTKGRLPKNDDERIVFLKGWFQNTLPTFLKKASIKNNLIVHYDADIYSSTLFCLLQIDTLKKKYTAIFDEFQGDEVRALSDYQEISGAKVEFLGKTTNKMGYCIQVSCLIIPLKKFKVD